MTADELEAIWRTIGPPVVEGELEGRRIAASGDIWAALDVHERPHLLLLAPEAAELTAVDTHGLSTTIGSLRVAGEKAASYVDIVCLEREITSTFAAVAADIATVAETTPYDARPRMVTELLAKWRWFWDVDPDRLGELDALGLFGELWFLLRWIGVSDESVSAWSGSDMARHDFQWPSFSVEVKTTASRAPGGATHRITALDQLSAPESGQLFLFSLRLSRDLLAANTLPSLVDQARTALESHPMALRELDQKLSRRGYSPAHRERHSTRYRIAEERMYRVADDFPRLTEESFAGDIPPGVTDVSYVLAMAACDRWRVATSPDQWVRP